MNSKKVRTAMGAGLASVMAVSLVPAPALADAGSDEASFVAKLNDLRMSRGLRPLGVNGSLVGVARSWSSRMASRGGISHNPNLAAQAPGNWVRVGENVGVGPSVDSLHNAFVASPSHYANMVNPYYESVGVGVVHSAGTILVTFNFMATSGGGSAVSSRGAAAAGGTRRVCRKARRGRVVCKRVRVKARKARAGSARKGTKARRARRASSRRR